MKLQSMGRRVQKEQRKIKSLRDMKQQPVYKQKNDESHRKTKQKKKERKNIWRNNTTKYPAVDKKWIDIMLIGSNKKWSIRQSSL